MAEPYWIVGINAVSGVLERQPERVLELCLQSNENERLASISTLAEKMGVAWRQVAPRTLAGWASDGRRHQGVAARVRPAAPLAEADLKQHLSRLQGPALWLVLDGVSDPHNLGACARSAAAAGVAGLIMPKDGSAPLGASVHRASAGMIDALPVYRVSNLARTLKQLKEQGVWVYGADGSTGTDIYQTTLPQSLALVVGSEGAGVRARTAALCDGLLAIPMAAGVESLNVSVAAALMLFEARRQRS